MSGQKGTLLFSLDLSSELMLSDLPVIVWDQELRPVAKTLSTNPVDLPPGTYYVTALMPAGQEMRGSVNVVAGQSVQVRLKPEPQDRSPHEYQEVQHYLGKALENDPYWSRSLMVNYLAPTRLFNDQAVLRCITGNLLLGEFGEAPPLFEKRALVGAVRLDITGYADIILLQLLQPGRPAVNVSFPSGSGGKCYLFITRSIGGYSLDVHLQTTTADLLLSYLESGLLTAAELTTTSSAIADASKAEDLLSQKMRDPVAACVGAYALLRFGEISKLHDWTKNLRDWYEWLPDGLTIWGEHLARLGRHAEALVEFLALPRRGLPFFVEGFSYALNRLRLYSTDVGNLFSDDERQQAKEVLYGLERYTPFVDFGKFFLTFTGINPAEPDDIKLPANLEQYGGIDVSEVFNELDVNPYSTYDLSPFDYCGTVGAYAAGAYASGLISVPELRTLMSANCKYISLDPRDTDDEIYDIRVPGFVQLVKVPDLVWKREQSINTPHGRKRPEDPNHYAPMDFAGANGQTLDELVPKATSLQPKTWRQYYESVGLDTVSQQGLLPFRVWQIYTEMVNFVLKHDVEHFVAAAGVLPHYIGDACQPLRSSYLINGDPYRTPDGSPTTYPLEMSSRYGFDLNIVFERDVLDNHAHDILIGLRNQLAGQHQQSLVRGGQEAGFAVVELMRRTRERINPLDLVNVYGRLVHQQEERQAPGLIWEEYQQEIIGVIADGCSTLAMIWESAWVEGGGNDVPHNKLSTVSPKRLKEIYEDREFLPSATIWEIDQHLL